MTIHTYYADYLVIGHLFHVQVSGVEHLHPCISVVITVKSTPWMRNGIEWVNSLLTTLQFQTISLNRISTAKPLRSFQNQMLLF